MAAPGETESDDFRTRFDLALGRLTPAGLPGRWLVALSGGLDSTLLLNAVTRAEPRRAVVAVHVDHGLHAESAAWSAHCRALARNLGVDFIARELGLAPGAGESLEAAAREARYAVLAGLVEPGDLVLTAHHADDQLETVLLRLMRGTGVRGLAAIRETQPFGPGTLARPLLEFTRAEIEIEAKRLGLVWLEDPSNADMRFDRNYLRAGVLPRLVGRWPAAPSVASRLARQMAETAALLDEIAAGDLAAVEDEERIPVAVLESLSEPRRNNALRFAIRRLGLPVPSAAQLKELRLALPARDDAEACVRWPGAEARLYRRHLYLLRPRHVFPDAAGRLDPDAALALAGGELRLVPTDGYGIPDRWARDGLDVAFRAGGERFRPRSSRYHKSLKQWFQESGIVPWMRGAVPLIYHDDRLIAVADICLADDLPQTPDDAPFWRPVWTNHPRLR